MAITGATDLGNKKLLVTVNHNPTQISTNVPAGSLIVTTTGLRYRKVDDGNNTHVELETSFDHSNKMESHEYYNEYSYDVNGNLFKVETYLDKTKIVRLWTKTFTYASGKLTDLKVFRELIGDELNRKFTYDVNGNLISIETV
jgi:hypothetical protein